MFLQDLNRQVVKSDAASFTIPELEFESPAFSQKGGKGLPLPFFFFVAGGWCSMLSSEQIEAIYY